MRKQFAILILLLSSCALWAQDVFRRNDSVPVTVKSALLKLPWASGINSAQINQIDLNSDGLKDLFILENNNESNFSTGDKTYTFINSGGPGEVKYSYEPGYISYFPKLEEYAILRDYDCDGREDIFSRDVSSRMSVYRNTGSAEPDFELFKRVLTTDTTQIPPNPAYFHYGEIFWGFHDLPSITDIDGDGDLDILSAPTNPHFIEYNKNRSIELYGNCDSLDFELKSTCWGRVLEDTGSVVLNMCDIVNVPNPEITGEGNAGDEESGLHTHDAMLALDLNGDSVMDLIEGDFARNTLYSMINGGAKDSSYITSFTPTYPAANPFNAGVYGQPYLADLNNDGKEDLVVSVYNDRLQDTSGIWYYENTGSSGNPVFQLVTKNFLQGEMIDVGTQSKPVFFNYNGDSLPDLVIGNLGYFTGMSSNPYLHKYTSQLMLFENTGSRTMPAFKLIDSNFAQLPSYNLNVPNNLPTIACHPTFGDLDNDGDEDMIIGDYRGKVHYFENSPVGGKANFVLAFPELLGIDVGEYSTPQLFDLNGDGKLDLIIGESEGNINYYENTSSAAINFTLVNDSLGLVDVKEDWDWVGFSSPFFFTDSLGEVKLISGSKAGHFLLYDSILDNGSINSKFRLADGRYESLWDGIYSTIHGGDVDGDGKLDVVTGNQSGGLVLYTSLDSQKVPFIVEHLRSTRAELLLFPNPAGNEIRISVECNCSGEFEYSVYNAQGVLVARASGTSTHNFRLDNYDGGVYMVLAQNSDRSVTATGRFVRSD